ncbi:MULTISPECIES: ATP-binding cassette domain-containing protein [unclassified Shewanella]|jgi:phosphonate transport system ATP-binding protein|uniref:ATP-binding cassette domain-containing protein n=1 Tax=unclassified Shewanella TaxID=196818 RepID=UPI000C346747|nr:MULTISPECIES: ATP-binding cassette domain-containing protein [unclassified Shewanella]MBB1364058.1 ATP-binding cassette domain-containing protein [Shewanella sp. SR44-4]PKH29379.1 phosphonate ABC transporter ATP-binding protein [Shewanella sp. ALD9]QHS12999.1 ATP-binding cassette domain-containing protein [Shewanella sp. Arc9-LZ]
MLSLVDVDLGYNQQIILPKVNLSFKANEHVAILGPSGVGKTTLLHHLYQQLAEQTCLCSQAQGLVDNLSIYHNVFIGGLARYSRWYNLANLLLPFNKPQQQIAAICQQLELTVPLQQKVNELSGGQRQRVALARALFQQQAVFMGDEPFSALDPLMGLRLLNLIKQTHQSVICVLHDAELALANFERIIVISDGKVVLDDKASQLSLAHLSQHYALADLPNHSVA